MEEGGLVVYQDMQIDILTTALAEHDAQVSALTRALRERNALIASLRHEVKDRERQAIRDTERSELYRARIEALTQAAEEWSAKEREYMKAVAALTGRIEALSHAIGERDQQIVKFAQELAFSHGRTESLAREVTVRSREIADLTEQLLGRDRLLTDLKRAAGERDERIAVLEREIREKDVLIQRVGVNAVQVHYRLVKTRASLAWKLGWPLRVMRNWWWRLHGQMWLDLIPFHQLRRDGVEWVAAGNDAQFLLATEHDWPVLQGWYWLEMRVACAHPVTASLYFDLGAGFDVERAVSFRFSGEGVQRIPLYVPHSCRAIRFDPCDAPMRFRLARPRLIRLHEAPALPQELAGQAEAYGALRKRGEEIAALDPVNEIGRDTSGGFTWRSGGIDPWFMVKHAAEALRPGWHEVLLCIRTEPGKGRAKLYFDYGQGYSEANCVELPFVDGETISRLFHLRAAPRCVRLDPLEQAAGFSVELLRFSPVTPVAARNRMLRRLCERHAHYQGERSGRVWSDIKALAKERRVPPGELLERRYGQTFVMRSVRDGQSYARWIAKFEAPEIADVKALQTAQERFAHRPTVSVLMPVYNTAEDFLRRAIESVLAQSYPHWELCVADDASTEPHVRAVLEEYARRDPRVKVTYRAENGHISAASNSALALATGEFVALLDHDDELAPHALHFVVAALNEMPSACILYSDEDKIDATGERSDPHFKPEWNPDLFLSQNYVSHLGVYRRDLLGRIGGFRQGVEGSQDYDLMLRCLPHLTPGEIVHVPKVLYHWRTVEGSTALQAERKSYTAAAGIRALRDFFDARGRQDVVVEAGMVPNTYRVRYPVPRPEPLVSLLIPTRDRFDYLERCVRSILEKTTYPNYEILILDNGSTELDTLAFFERVQREYARVRVVSYPHPFNFSAINNFGVRNARGEVIGLVNNDVEVITPEWLTEMVSHALRPEIGCVGAKLYYDDETIQHAGVILGIGGVAGHSHKYFPRSHDGYFSRLKVVQNVSAVTAACLVVRKAVYEEVGGLDEDNLAVAFNDVDFCLKVRQAGYRNLWTPYAELYHHESKSRGIEDTPVKVERFHREAAFIRAKWDEALVNDPCYSRNLTLMSEDFSFL